MEFSIVGLMTVMDLNDAFLFRRKPFWQNFKSPVITEKDNFNQIIEDTMNVRFKGA